MEAIAELGTEDYEAFVAPHLAALTAVAVREVGAADGPDVVQEALLRAWRRRSTFEADKGSPRAWLVGVLLDQARRHRVRRRLVPHLPRPVAAEPDGARLDVERAVRTLPPRQRQVVVLHYLADLPIADVAAVLGISVGSVKSHLHDARTRLKTLLEDS